MLGHSLYLQRHLNPQATDIVFFIRVWRIVARVRKSEVKPAVP